MSAEAVFWICILLAGYAFLGYPLMAVLLARNFGSSVRTRAAFPPITVVIAARNEASRVPARVQNLLEGDYPAHLLSILLVDDGSSDGTADVARGLDDPRVRVLRQSPAGGKAAALNLAMAHVETAITVFADARQTFDRGTLTALVAPFADPSVGVVSGELVCRAADGAGHPVAAEGSYARIERALRFAEARLGWAHAASGAVYAIRTSVFRPLPEGLILDDVFTPVQALRQGLRVWVARDAVARDVAGSDLGVEFRRKLRTLTGNWQLMANQAWLLHPRRNPALLAWLSHKLARLLAPWALLGALGASALADGPWMHAAFTLQLAGYGLALAALHGPAWASRIPLAATAGSFLSLNVAALLSLPMFMGSRDVGRLWRA